MTILASFRHLVIYFVVLCVEIQNTLDDTFTDDDANHKHLMAMLSGALFPFSSVQSDITTISAVIPKLVHHSFYDVENVLAPAPSGAAPVIDRLNEIEQQRYGQTTEKEPEKTADLVPERQRTLSHGDREYGD